MNYLRKHVTVLASLGVYLALYALAAARYDGFLPGPVITNFLSGNAVLGIVAMEGVGMELDAIAAVVVGGTLLAGGVGSVIGTLIGVLMLGLILTSITTYEGMMSSGMTRVAIGLLLLAFVLMQKLLTRRFPGELHGA